MASYEPSHDTDIVPKSLLLECSLLMLLLLLLSFMSSASHVLVMGMLTLHGVTSELLYVPLRLFAKIFVRERFNFIRDKNKNFDFAGKTSACNPSALAIPLT